MSIAAISAVLFAEDLYLDVPDAPFQGFFVGIKECIEPVSPDGSAPVEYFYGLPVIIAGDDYFAVEGVSIVGGNEGVSGFYFMTTGCYTV